MKFFSSPQHHGREQEISTHLVPGRPHRLKNDVDALRPSKYFQHLDYWHLALHLDDGDGAEMMVSGYY